MTSSPKPRPLPRLHLVTNEALLQSPSFLERCTALLRSGRERVALHLRGRRLGGRELWELAEQARRVADEHGAWLFINDRVDIANAAGADGVQLGRESLSIPDARGIGRRGILVGASVHDVRAASAAAEAGADFLLAGTLFESSSHPGRPGAGTDWLRQLSRLDVPVIGIGGITAARTTAVISAGAHGVAVISGIWEAVSPVEEMERYLRKVEGEDG